MIRFDYMKSENFNFTYCDYTHKRRYKTQKDAQKEIARIAKCNSRKGFDNQTNRLKMYLCKECGGYHLTSESRKTYRKIYKKLNGID